MQPSELDIQSSDSDSSVRSQIYTEQVAYLYNNAPLSYTFTIVNGFFLTFLQRSVISNQVLWTWLSILLLVTLFRTILVYLHYRKKSVDIPTAYWHWAYLTGTAMAGSVWGSAAVFLFPAEEIEHQLLVIFVLAGMTAAGLTVLAASLIAFFLFTLPILIPLALQIFWQGATLSTPMAMMVLFYLLGLSVSARGMNRTILTSLSLRFDNRELLREIIERQVAEEELYQQKERLQITFSAMAEGVIIVNSHGSIEYLNPAAENMSGWLNSEAKGKNVEQIFTHIDESTGESKQSAIYECLKTAVRSKNNTLLLARGCERRIIEEIASVLKNRTGQIIGAVAIIRDITQASEHSRELAFQASHDALTALPNRTLLSDRLDHAISKASRANSLVAILFMDLNRFKQINDSFGHGAGDKLLRKVAERLSTSVRKEDTVARLGGDEFVVVLEDLIYEYQATGVAQKIVDNLANPLTIEGQKISVGVSIGISLFPRDGEDVETLLKNADTAMYRIKELRENNIQFYTVEMNAQALERLKTEQHLQQAVERNELELYYQPRVTMDSEKIVGLEALVRWRTSPNTLVSPAEFIHIAEETDIILRIGEWVLQTACQQAQSWHKNGHHDLRIAINLSVRQIRSTNIVDLVAEVLRDTKLDPELLELEITESIFLKDAEQAIIILRNLKELGIKLAIDDFGTGYSSLSYIKRFPIDILKIDRSFIHDISEEPGNGAIIPAIISMGHGLNLEVVAEGVESEAQRKYLRDLACNSFQGFHFSKPLSATEVSRLLHTIKPVRQSL